MFSAHHGSLAALASPARPAAGPSAGRLEFKLAHDRALMVLVACASISCAGAPPPWSPPDGTVPPGAVVVLGIDGLDRQMLERMMDAGELPAFSRLTDEGVTADLRVDQPILSPRIWTTLASGYGAGTHGIVDWVRRDGSPYRASDIRTKRVWDVASEAQRTVLVAGWLMTTPVNPVHGVMLSDELVLRGSLDMFRGLTPGRDPAVEQSWLLSPAERWDDVQHWIPERRWAEDHALGWQVAEYGELLHPLLRDETQVRAFEASVGELQPELSMLYLSGADQLAHQYWPFSDPAGVRAMQGDPGMRQRSAEALLQQFQGKRRLPLSAQSTTADDLEEGARWMATYMVYLDSLLSRVMQRVDPHNATLIVCSDHGFQTRVQQNQLVTDHESPAVLLAWGADVRTDNPHPQPMHELDVAPSIYALLGLPAAQDMPGTAATSMFSVQPVPPVATHTTAAPLSTSGPTDHPRRQQLEALGYIDGRGRPISQSAPR